ncbi:MAG: SDR family NAD(P)-dependent oxidoreductase [Spirochaetia bacterium]
MKKRDLKGKTACISGASGGIGKEIAKELASYGVNCVLAARSRDKLDALQEELVAAYGVKASVVEIDLSRAEAANEFYEAVGDLGWTIDILVNNAGFGIFGNFAFTQWAKTEKMLDLDITSLTHIAHLFLKDMIAQKSGIILNVSSIAAFQPTPSYAVYSAAKSYVLMFSEALRREVKGAGVFVSALCPGVTETGFLSTAGQKKTLYQKAVIMSPEQVAKAAVAGMIKNKPAIVPGLLNKITAVFPRFVPRQVSAVIAAALMREN